jgi:cell division protein FtsB
MLLIFSLILLYFFYAAILGTLSYQYLKKAQKDKAEAEE